MFKPAKSVEQLGAKISLLYCLIALFYLARVYFVALQMKNKLKPWCLTLCVSDKIFFFLKKNGPNPASFLFIFVPFPHCMDKYSTNLSIIEKKH